MEACLLGAFVPRPHSEYGFRSSKSDDGRRVRQTIFIIYTRPKFNGILHSHDLDFLIECDDEYWISPDGQPLFEQPPDKPSKVSAFNCLIRLTQVLALVHRTLVSTCASVYLRSLTFIYFILYSIRPSLPKTQLKATGRRGS